MKKPIIRLWEFAGIGLIMSHPSGVIYSNQTGGYLCRQPEMEGVFAVLFDDVLSVADPNPLTQLVKFFTGPKWKGSCANGIDEESADFIDELLNEHYSSSFVRVNRENWPIPTKCGCWANKSVTTIAPKLLASPVEKRF